MTERYDLLIIGGGVNGAGIARDAAGRGLKVLLCEKGDLAEGTSSTAEDVLERRTKHYLHMSEAERDDFAARMARAS